MDTPIQSPPTVVWPTPPFFRLAESPPGAGRDCALELLEGRVTGGELVEFELGKDSIGLILREAVGCDACRDGYKGRVVVYELLAGTSEIKHLIRSHAAVPQLVTAAQADGMLSLRQNAIEKVLRGVLDLTSARAVSR